MNPKYKKISDGVLLFRSTTLLTILFGLLSVALNSVADTLTLNSGEKIKGEIVSEGETKIVIEPANQKGTLRTVDKSEIRTIERDGASGEPAAVERPNQLDGASAKDPLTPFSYSGNAFDFIVNLSNDRKLQMAIDPAVLTELSKTKIAIAKPSIAPRMEILESHLKPHGFVLISGTLTTDKTVPFVTRRAAITYFRAINNVRDGNYNAALTELQNGELDNSLFAAHCLDLRNALKLAASRYGECLALEQNVRLALANLKNSVAALRNAEISANAAITPSSARAAIAHARDLNNKAVHDLGRLEMSILQCLSDTNRDNKVVAVRFLEAEAANLLTEATFYINFFVDAGQRLRTVSDLLKREGLMEAKDSLTDPPDELVARQTLLRAFVHSSSEYCKDAITVMSTDNEKAYALFSAAYNLDSANLVARIGMGYCHLQHATKALAELGKADGGEQGNRILITEFRDTSRGELLEILATLTKSDLNFKSRAKPAKIGSVNGVAVSQGSGKIFPLSVSIEPVKRTTVTRTRAKEDYWGNIVLERIEYEVSDIPISFGDYGDKDPLMWVAAVQALKWLRSFDDAIGNSVGLKVEFHSLIADKGGDSAGVTMAVGGYSKLMGAGIKQSVAMTGSIRADGAVKAVGGVPIKITGAFQAEGVNTVIVPKENEASLLLVPADELCRITIIVADDISTYLKYAIESATEKSRPDQQLAWKAVKQLQIAQVLILCGERTVATKLLEAIADERPEIYNARRLLALLKTAPVAEREQDAKLLGDAKTIEEASEKILTAYVTSLKASDVAAIRDVQLPSVVRAPASVTEPPRKVDLNSGLIAYFPLNGSTEEKSGNGHRTTARGIFPAENSQGRANGAISFSGANSYVEISRDDAMPSGQADRTIAIWFKPRSISVGDRLLCYGEWSIGNAFHIDFHTGSTRDSGVIGVITHTRNYSSRGTVPLDKWTHVAAVVENRRLKIYINGQLDSTQTFNSATKLTGGVWRIGAGISDKDLMPFNGAISEVYIFGRALSEAEIQNLLKPENKQK